MPGNMGMLMKLAPPIRVPGTQCIECLLPCESLLRGKALDKGCIRDEVTLLLVGWVGFLKLSSRVLAMGLVVTRMISA